MSTRRHVSASSSSHKAISLFALLLYGRKPYSLTQLAEALDCSRQTVLRLVDEISCVDGFSVEQWKDKGQNWYQLNMPDKKAHVYLNRDELHTLMACHNFVAHLLPASFAKDAQSAIAKASLHTTNALPLPLDMGLTLLKGGIDYTPFEASLSIIINAQQNLQVLEVQYTSRTSSESRLHCIVPVRFVVFRDALYIRCWSVNDRGSVEIRRPMTLAIHRMQEIFQTRRYLDYKKHQESSFPEENDYFGIADSEKPFVVRIAFSPSASVYVKERRWGAEQIIEEKADGHLHVSFQAQSEYEILKWVLSFGSEAELLSPVSLREQVQAELLRLMDMYTKR